MAKEKPKIKTEKAADKMAKLSIRLPANVKAAYQKKLIDVDETMQNHILLMILHYLKYGDFCAAKA